MKKIEKEENKEEQNEYAKNIKGETIYIVNAESGAKGYFCIGCNSEMQAVKSKIKGRKLYFRHHCTDVKKNQRKCTFSNQDYRHSQAISILNRIRVIKVPALYKYPPINSDGNVIKIQDSKLIEAAYTKSELTFYETDYGDVKFGKNPGIDNRNLLIRPDVTFFNEKNEPILLIEIVVTHKIDFDKLAKIKRLGIDTIEVTIPKDSLENIEKSFSLGQKIKWIHNNEQERTEYIYSSIKNAKGFLQIDEHQRKLFEESYECRKSQIKELTRSITMCLESEQYRKIEREFRQEIQRVEDNTRRAEKDLNDYKNRIREGVEQSFKTRRDELKTKRHELDREEEESDRKHQDEERELEGYYKENEEAIKGQDRELEKRYFKRRRGIKEEYEEVREAVEEIEYFESIETKYKDEGERVRSRINQNIRIRKDLPERFKQLNERECRKFKREERKLEIEFEGIREQTIRQIKNKNIGGSTELSSKLKTIFNTRGILDDWDEKQSNFERYKKAYECFRDGTYKKWY